MTLLAAIEKNPEVRLIFGKRELAIMRKQLLGVRLKPSERTRLSRDIRKKLDVVRTLSAFEKEFALRKGAEIKRIIEETMEIMRETKWFPRIRRVFLFGSAAEDQLALNSDVDFAVEFSALAKGEATLFRKHVLGRTSEKADVQVFNTLPDKLKKEVVSKGRILYEKNTG